MVTTHAPVWQLQEAKNRLSMVIDAVEAGEVQTITRHGKPVAVVVPIALWETTHPAPGPSLLDLLLPPEGARGEDLAAVLEELRRNESAPRPVALG